MEADRAEVLDVPGVILTHEGRISALESDQRSLTERVGGLEGKLDKLYALGWRLFVGILIAIAAPFVAMMLQHVR